MSRVNAHIKSIVFSMPSLFLMKDYTRQYEAAQVANKVEYNMFCLHGVSTIIPLNEDRVLNHQTLLRAQLKL